MALFNKLFSSRKKTFNKTEENTCHRAFTFHKEQTRVVLFRECDFRGRKLLFDSKSVERVTLDRNRSKCNGTTNKTESFVEISNDCGYLYTKPQSDIGQIGEMVFGAVAMSFRGTSLKIHSLSTPVSLMCTQVFPSPRQHTRTRFSVPSKTCEQRRVSTHSLDYSLRFDDSGASSTNSMCEQLSVYSSGSDTKLVCRGSSIPLDVPSPKVIQSNNLSPSVIGDSGFGGDQSYSSVSSGTASIPQWELALPDGSNHAFSCGSLYKRWLRSTSTSLDCTNHPCISMQFSASADECIPRRQQRASKLGLAVIIQLGDEQFLEQFLLEHAPLLEAMVWRARAGAEIAYMRQGNFASLMYEIYLETTYWLEALLTGPQLQCHLWLTLCDIKNSISNNQSTTSASYLADYWKTSSLNDLEPLKCKMNSNGWVVVNPIKRMSSVLSLQSDFTAFGDGCDMQKRRSGLQIINFGSFLRSDFMSSEQSVSNGSCTTDCSSKASLCKNIQAEKFIKDLCELLESVDAKHTNFFISTLVTAVLTYHLGWVATALPPSKDEAESVSQLHNQYNPLWGQLSDLYGAIGHPTKVAHTIVSGTNKSELIAKILNTLTYFIRCSDLERKCVNRISMEADNVEVDGICQKASCIPKESLNNTYEQLVNDTLTAHNRARLKEINVNKDVDKKCSSKSDEIEMKPLNIKSIELTSDVNEPECCISNESELTLKESFICNSQMKAGLLRTHTYLNDLQKLKEDRETEPNQSECLYPNLKDLDLSEERILDLPKNISEELNIDCSTESTSLNSAEKSDMLNLSASEITEKVGKLCRVPFSAVMYHINTAESDTLETLANIQEAKENINKVFSSKKINMEVQRNASIISDVIKQNDSKEKDVIFVLGDNDQLIGLKKSCSDLYSEEEILRKKELKPVRPTTLDLSKKSANPSKSLFYCNSSDTSLDSPVTDCSINPKFDQDPWITPETSFEKRTIAVHSQLIDMESESGGGDSVACKKEPALPPPSSKRSDRDFNRSHSVPPPEVSAEVKTVRKLRHSGVKFNFQQYPQIVTEYMKSKNLELANLPFADKAMKLNRSLSSTAFGDCSQDFDFSSYDCDSEEMETLQTPSNASELEFTNELFIERREEQHAREKIEYIPPKKFIRNTLPNTVIKEAVNCDVEHPLKIKNASEESQQESCVSFSELNQLKIIELPMPKSMAINAPATFLTPGYSQSLLRGISERYISNMVLQGISSPQYKWETNLKRDLTLAARHPLLDQPIQEAVTIVANTDTWEVQLISSHTYVVDRGSSGVRVGMSQLVSNMLESLLNMWKLHTPVEYCLMHIEAKLKEMCLHSKALAQLLIATEFCSMELLTSSLQLEVNDVPLLMAVASTHSPKVTQKYGLSFQ